MTQRNLPSLWVSSDQAFSSGLVIQYFGIRRGCDTPSSRQTGQAVFHCSRIQRGLYVLEICRIQWHAGRRKGNDCRAERHVQGAYFSLTS